MGQRKKNRRASSRRKSNFPSRQAAHSNLETIESMDEFGDEGTTGLWSTGDLPQTGHDEAVDDGQQQFRAASILMRVAHGMETQLKDRITARRLRALADEVSPGIREQAQNNPDLFSTAPHEEPMQDGAAKDDNNPEGSLQFFGTYPTSPGNAGPEERSASRQAADEDLEDGPDEVELPEERSDSKEANRQAQPLDLEEDDEDGDSIFEQFQGAELQEKLIELEEVRDDELLDMEEDQSRLRRSSRAASTRIRPPKKGQKTRVRTASGKKAKVWDTIKKALRSRVTAGGRWGKGGWETKTEDFGRSLSLNIDTHSADGTPLIASNVTFNLLGEDRKRRVARIEVSDNALHHEVSEIEVSERNASKLAEHWAKQAELVGKSFLEE